VPHKQRNISLAFPQRRNVYGKNIQAKEEIGRNFCSATIASKSRFVAAIKRASVRSVRELPSRSNSLSCSTRSSFGLQFERNFSYFVQKNRAAISHFESPNPLRDRSRERAFLVSEQLAFEQACRIAAQLSLTKGFERRGLKS